MARSNRIIRDNFDYKISNGVLDYITQNPDATIEEIADEFDTNVNTMGSKLREHGGLKHIKRNIFKGKNKKCGYYIAKQRKYCGLPSRETYCEECKKKTSPLTNSNGGALDIGILTS